MAGCEPIKSFRAEKKLTQEALGKLLGVTSITVSRWETGARQIGPDLLPDVSAKTGIPAKVLRPDLAESLGVEQ